MASANKRRRPLTVTQDKTKEPHNKRRSKNQKNVTQPSKTVPSNFFTTSLSDVGFQFGYTGNKIGCESHSFRQKLIKFLMQRDVLSESLQEFFSAMEDTLSDEDMFVAGLFPSELDSNDNFDMSSQNSEILQDSLIKLLLSCDELQGDVLEYLIKKLPLYTENENVKVNLLPTLSGGTEVANIPRLILNHLRWLDFINESSALASKLLEMASVMQSMVACDIISFVPDLLTDECDHSTVAATLCDLLNNGPEKITSAVFDALSNLMLPNSMLKEMQDLAISNLACGSVEDMPVVVKYLLKSCKTVDVGKEVIAELRPHLDFSVLLSSDGSSALIRSSTTLIADAIFSSIQFHSVIASAWISVLDRVNDDNVHVGDVVCLFLLCIIHNPQHSKQATVLLYSKIRNNQLPFAIVQKSFELCSYLFHSHFKGVCKLAKNMVWSSSQQIRKMGALLYEMFLLHMDNFCKQEAIGYLVEHISSVSNSGTHEADTALDVLCIIASNKPEVLTSYANYIRDALDRMDIMSLKQTYASKYEETDTFQTLSSDQMTSVLDTLFATVNWFRELISVFACESDDDFKSNVLDRLKQACELQATLQRLIPLTPFIVLSSLAYNECTDAATLGMRDEMHMVLQKQLTHVSDKYHHIGIIGCVSTMVAISRMDQNANFNKSKELSSLMQTMNYVLRNDILGWAIFYDEIYLVTLGNSKICKSLAKKVSTDARVKLEKYFLSDKEESSSSATKCKLDSALRYFLLPEDQHSESDVSIKIVNNNNKLNAKQMSPLLCSLFCAIAALEKTQSSDLGEIDALLCCPLQTYASKYEETDTFQTLSSDQMTSVLDTLFATVNWFRELISVFACESDDDFKSNVLDRLKQACELQATLQRLIPLTPNGYVPPFMGSGKREATVVSWRTVAASSETKKMSKTLDCSTMEPKKLQKEKKAAVAPVAITTSLLRPHLRELNIDVFSLFQYPVQFCKENHVNSTSEGLFILPSHLLYLLNDLKQKVKHRLVLNKLPPGFGHKSGGNSDIGFEKLDQLSMDEVVTKVVKLTTHLQTHLTALAEKLKSKTVSGPEDADSDDSMSSVDSGIFLKEHETIADCFESILEILLHVLTWNCSHQNTSPQSLLHQFLGQLCSKGSDSAAPVDNTAMLSGSFRCFVNFSSILPSSTCGCIVLKLLTSLHGLVTDNKSQQTWMAKKISKAADDFLKVDWNDCAGNPSKVSPALQAFFAAFLKYSEDPLLSIETFIKHALPDILGDNSEPNQEDDESHITYPLLTKANFHILYKGMFEVLGTTAAAIPTPSTAKSNASRVDNVDLLLRWSEAVKVLEMLIHILKSFSSRSTIGPALKHAKSVVESFVRTGIPACEVTFREHQDDVINLLKKIQSSTRQLQHLACHSKVSKDSSLTNHVPALKRSLETFVFRVKALMVLHNCHEAFWLGNLKNRNLQGEEILSQMPTAGSSDDDSDDVTPQQGDKTTEQSYSESY